MKQLLLLAFTLIILKSQSQSITVNYPNGGDTMYNCNTDTIRFTATGTSTFYNIDYSVNGGTTWQSVITNIKITDGKYAWKVPINVAHSSNCLIRVYDKLTPTLRDSSNAVFNIFKPIIITSPNGGEVLNGYTYKNITWTTYNKSTSNVFTLYYSLNGGTTWQLVTNVNVSGNSFNWLVPSVAASTNCLIKIIDAINTCKVDISDAAFTINPPLPIIKSAGGGEIFRTGELNRIVWDTASIISKNVRLEYSVDSGKTWIFIDSVAKTVGVGYGYPWDVPFQNSAKCFIKVVNNSSRSVFKVSDTAFTILPAVTIYSPFKGDTFYTCNSTVINFDRTEALSNTFVMEYQEAGSNYWQNIGSGSVTTYNLSIAYTWRLPQKLKYGLNKDIIIRIYPLGYDTYASYSDTFHIKTSISLVTPKFDGNYKPGDTVLIKWNAEGTNNSFDIGASYKVGNIVYYDPKYIASNYVTSTNEYQWIVPNESIVGGKIGVRDNIDTCKEDKMYSTYTISKLDTAIRLINGNGGDTITGCSTYNITWKLNSSITALSWVWDLYYYDVYTANYVTIVTGLSRTLRNYSWTVPDINQDIVIYIKAKDQLLPYTTFFSDFSDTPIHINKIGFKAYPQDTIVCAGSKVQLNASLGYTNYAWTPNYAYISDTSIRNPIATVYYDQTYTVKAKLGTCVVTDNVVLKVVSPTALATINISTDAATKCAGKAITSTSNTTNAGSNAIYQWYVNGVLKDSSTNTTFTYNKFKNNDSIWCVLNSSLCVAYKSEQSNVVKIVFPFTPTVTNDYLNSCTNVTYNGNVYPTSTIVKDTLKFIDGCDSVYHNMNIVIKNVTTTTKNTNIIGCNQVAYKSNVYNTSTTLQDTLKSYLGCDSVYNVTNIIVNTPSAPKDTFATVCNGLNWYGTVYTKDTIATHSSPNYVTSLFSEGFSGVTIADVPTGWTFSTNFSTYTTTGNYGVASPSLRFAATNDQIITPTLPASATKLSFWLKNQGATGCSLKIEGYNGTSWVTINTITSFPTSATIIVYNATSTPALPTALTKFRFTYTKSSGNIALDDVSINYITGVGCDSTVALHLTIKKSITTNSNLSGCVVKYKAITYTASTNIVDTIKSNLGCDSIYKNISITILAVSTTTQTQNLFGCNSVVYNGITYTNTTIKRDTIKTINGCDSIYKVANITIKKITPTAQSVNYYACGSSLTYNGNNYTASTVVKDTFKTTQGCDSFYMTANIIVGNITATSITDTLSNCNSVTYKGITYFANTTKYDTIRTTHSCDSIYHIVKILIVPIPFKDSSLHIIGCNNIVYEGNTYLISTSFLDTIKSVGNCDSIYLDVYLEVRNNVYGNIKHPTKGNINNVTVKLNGSNANTLTASGGYAFNCLPNLAYGSVKLSKNNDVKKNNGISGIDVILVTNHILNKNKLNSPYKLIAADVNNNKTITNIDLIFMKRLILGTDTTFAGNRLWAFVDSSYTFPDTTNPFPYKDSISFLSVPYNQPIESFIGVKLGDVNYDWNATVARGKSISNLELLISNSKKQSTIQQSAISNNKLEIPFSVKNFKDLTALQYTLHFNHDLYEFVEIRNNKLEIEYNAAQATSNGSISFLWADAKGEEKTLEDGSEIFTLVLKSRRGMASSEWEIRNMKLEINNDITEIEAWDKDNQQHNIILSQKTKDQELKTKDWFTVSPNPSDGNIVISLSSNTNKHIVFELSNAVGKTLYTQSFEAVKGNNIYRLNLNKNAKLPSGIYFIKTIGIDGENVKRLIIQ